MEVHMKRLRQFWMQLSGRDRFKSIEDRLDALERVDQKKRKGRKLNLRRARLQQKWLQNLKTKPLSEEEQREWASGD